MTGDRSGMRRRAIGWLVLAAVAVPTVVWAGGLAPVQTLLLAVLGSGVVAVARFRPSAVDVEWPAPAVLAPDKGARREIARLSWSVGRGGDSRVGSTSVRRLQELAARRLARRGLQLHDPADAAQVTELLGAGPLRLLTTPRGMSHVSPAAFREAVAAVERLGGRRPSERGVR
ncbi:MAG: hypothetical protein ACR2LI_07210 [Propionibacteriaceae bacterium]